MNNSNNSSSGNILNIEYKIEKVVRIFIVKGCDLLRKLGFNNNLIRKVIYRKSPYSLENNILISKYNAIFIHTPKVASTSMKKVLISIIGGNQIGLVHKYDFPYVQASLINTKYKNYFRFSFVRNPYDRLVSCYKHKILKKPENVGKKLRGVYYNFWLLGNFYAGMSFKNFVKEICLIDDDKADSHFRSQSSILSDQNGKLLPNNIYKYENLEKDYIKILDKIGVKEDLKLPHLVKTEHKPYRDYYDEETRKLVEKRYKKDLELFNYKF